MSSPPSPDPDHEDGYEYKAVSEWLRENKGKDRTPEDDGWELIGGALRRRKAKP